MCGSERQVKMTEPENGFGLDHEGSPALDRSHYSLLGAVMFLLKDPSAMLESLVGSLGWEDSPR